MLKQSSGHRTQEMLSTWGGGAWTKRGAFTRETRRAPSRDPAATEASTRIRQQPRLTGLLRFQWDARRRQQHREVGVALGLANYSIGDFLHSAQDRVRDRDKDFQLELKR